jgi:putative IMPACT (imprinted ancient) family translation regulator
MFYKTILRPSSAKFSEKKSMFTAYAFPISSEEEAKQLLADAKKNHKEASHLPYAYRLQETTPNSTPIERWSDDGEPSKTAGFPIHKILQQKELTNTLIYVVRVFGGVKLGPAGLMRAFSTVAQMALEDNEIIEQEITSEKIIKTDIYHFSLVEAFLKQHQIEYKADFDAHNVTVTIKLSEGKKDLFEELSRLAS